MSDKTAEDYKALGNQSFASKDFPKAIEHYTKAIQLDSKNHVFFSNRSASYAGLKEWGKAVEDAKECIRLDPQFVKGYYRLATAQLELEEYDLAQATIKQGLAMDANNAPLLKLMGTIKKAKKAAATTAAVAAGVGGGSSSAAAGGNTLGGAGKLDQATSRELYDLEVQYKQSIREFQSVQVDLNKYQREQQMADATLTELEASPAVGAYYRSVGKTFLKSTRDNVLDHLKNNKEESVKKENDLTQKLKYLERRMTSQKQNMRELVSQSR
mmetsp:Transcript_22701/g.56103  ORF Transcript_22701/g.56103 Transcript_22701/m.56103 type:complete len:270 (-) Transcript_22701:125-934(-)|eukprot:CAMPEP_0113632128 /NCGR_PEP_ID=MMETSP0017_2-20120614/16696_1 /TAXON_ID=2856 /ORGANISM="Cylindrotheca closterium" /LENGTH=269 /DNA_ID=CAMNT_0000542665 /DNA_START=90 /DNA_END=899 /DNA_ORIENTATION=- /assembly_acc=CAM_ASM_000147